MKLHLIVTLSVCAFGVALILKIVSMGAVAAFWLIERTSEFCYMN